MKIKIVKENNLFWVVAGDRKLRSYVKEKNAKEWCNILRKEVNKPTEEKDD